MEWYSKECLTPKRTQYLVRLWQAPPNNVHDRYYYLFPHLYPQYLPLDHHVTNYDVSKYPKNRDYRTFKSAPPEIKSTHRVEWADGCGPSNQCKLCASAKQQNEEQRADYYRRLEAWKTIGTPM